MPKPKKTQAAYNVVLSWSGDRSRRVARAFREWLPTVLQSAKPWISETDIAKGSAWQGELGAQLDTCKVGIMFLTPENLQSTWLNFEAGALSKPSREGRVSTMLLGDLKPTYVPGPLALFQHTLPTKEDVGQLVTNLAEHIEADVSKSALTASFDNGWEKIESALMLERLTGQVEPRPERQLLEELVELARDIKRSQNRARPDAAPSPGFDLFSTLTSPKLSPKMRSRFLEYIDLKTKFNQALAEFDESMAKRNAKPSDGGSDSDRDRSDQ